jgi:urea carboxylase
VTTKYNPARTWTPENAVGIGGAYLCIYGMEGPGGYQFIGRTVPIWSRWHDRPPFAPGEPSLLRHFDRISWYPVSAEELLDLRADMRSGRLDLKTEEGTFSLADHEAFLAREAESINAFRRAQGVAFDAERNRWRASGEFNRASSGDIAGTDGPSITAPPGGRIVAAPLASSVWRVDTEPGATVTVGDILFTLEAMKLEITVTAPISGVIREILVRPGDQVPADRPLAILIEAPRDARTTERAQ